jgi:hypothetical protein
MGFAISTQRAPSRIAGAAILDAHPPRRRRILLREWRTEEGLED